MKTGRPALYLAFGIVTTTTTAPRLLAQPGWPADSIHACDLVTTADVQKVTGRSSQKPPDRYGNVQQTQSACDFGQARLWIALSFIPKAAEKHVEQELVVGGFDTAKQAVAGVGDSAVIYFKPKGRSPAGLLVAYAGTRTITVGLKMDDGQSSDSARPLAAGLAKIAVGRLR